MGFLDNEEVLRGAAIIEGMNVNDLKMVLNFITEAGGDAKRMISEIYSPPRVTAAARKLPHLGVVPGFAMDLRTMDEHGRPWNFDNEERRREARRRLQAERPMFLVGSPMCTQFCSWQHLNAQKRSPSEVTRDHVRAMVHMKFVCQLYEDQVKAGRYFIHEHPGSATSWTEDCIVQVRQLPGVDVSEIDQCQYDQTSKNGSPVRKHTRWMSNSPEVLKKLGKRCRGVSGTCTRPGGGVHEICSGSVARDAQEYPFDLCRAILKGCRKQLLVDGHLAVGLIGMQNAVNTLDEQKFDEMCHEVFNVSLETMLAKSDGGKAVYRDALTGQPLRPELVREARKAELAYFLSKNVWTKVAREEAYAKHGKAPITIKWIDVNKGDDERPQYRSRFVAREVRRKGEASIFAPTPPLEALRTILSMAATNLPGITKPCRDKTSEKRTQISVIDISRAYFNAVMDGTNPTYVELPEEDEDHGKGMCGRLNVHMYGTRHAAEGWHDEYADFLTEELGFAKGNASACVFRHAERGVTTSVYGDDFTTTGAKTDLDWFRDELKKKYELTEPARLGSGDGDDKEARILNRIVRWTHSGVEYEADPRQVERVVKSLGLEGAKPLGTAGVKVTAEQAADDEPLKEEKSTPFRALAARVNYLSADRPECQFAAKEICRWMAHPTVQSLAALKRLGRSWKVGGASSTTMSGKTPAVSISTATLTGLAA